jgi:hypothetical protein
MKLRKFEVAKEGRRRKYWSLKKNLVSEVYAGCSGGGSIHTQNPMKEVAYIHGIQWRR